MLVKVFHGKCRSFFGRGNKVINNKVTHHFWCLDLINSCALLETVPCGNLFKSHTGNCPKFSACQTEVLLCKELPLPLKISCASAKLLMDKFISLSFPPITI